METKNINIKDLTTNDGQIDGLPKNPRQIRDHRYEKLKKSIEGAPEMLQLRELLVYPHGGKFVIIGGNMRYRACKEIGYKELPCKVLDTETPVEKLRQYAIKDNENFGEYDWDIVANEWDTAEMEDWGVELPTDWGAELDGEEIEQKEIVEDEIPENVETKCKKGEIWQLGRHRLMCGDSTDGGDVALLMNGERADLVFTDPPYNVAIGSKNAVLNEMNHARRGHRVETEIAGDKGLTDAEIGEQLWKPAFQNMADHAKDDCSIYVTMPQGGTHMMMMMMMMADACWQVKYELMWLKNQPTFSMGRLDYDYKHEPIMYGWKKTHNFYGKGKFTKSVWEIDKPRESKLHPTMKPIELIANALENSTKENDCVLDVFGGSGSTLIACEQLNRACYMMELDPHYCDVIIARWEKLSGGTAVKIEDV